MKKILLATALFATSTAFAQNAETVIGCWNMPSRPGEAIQFNRGGSFTFSDYNAKTKEFESLYGNWMLSKNMVSLMYEDRPKQRFTLTKTKAGWRLTKAGGFRFTKAQPSECAANN